MAPQDVSGENGQKQIIAVTGPTASGKTAFAVSLARQLDGEIISADSRQVYRRMDIGTGKDLEDYGEIPYHLIDICEPGERYNLHRYVSDFHRVLDDITSRGKTPVLCGGTGLYLETVLSGIRLPDVPENKALRDTLQGKSLDELSDILRGYKSLHNTTDIDSCQRAVRAIEIEEFYRNNPDVARQARREEVTHLPHSLFLMDISRDLRRRRISERLESRLNQGMVDEVRRLLDEGIPPENLIYYGLEYKYLTLFILSEKASLGKASPHEAAILDSNFPLTFDEMKRRLEIEIHQFAKRQMTWFRGMERRGFSFTPVPVSIS